MPVETLEVTNPRRSPRYAHVSVPSESGSKGSKLHCLVGEGYFYRRANDLFSLI